MKTFIEYNEGVLAFLSKDKREKRKSFLRSLIKSVDTGANGTQNYIVKKGTGKNKIAKTNQ